MERGKSSDVSHASRRLVEAGSLGREGERAHGEVTESLTVHGWYRRGSLGWCGGGTAPSAAAAPTKVAKVVAVVRCAKAQAAQTRIQAPDRGGARSRLLLLRNRSWRGSDREEREDVGLGVAFRGRRRRRRCSGERLGWRGSRLRRARCRCVIEIEVE